MSNDEEYNGWPNYDTWLFNVSFDGNYVTELMEYHTSARGLKEWAEVFWNDEQGIYRAGPNVWTQRDWDLINFSRIYDSWREDNPIVANEDEEEDEDNERSNESIRT
jgi:hypothetical protein